MWPEFLAYWLEWSKERLLQLASGATFKEINKSTLKKLPISLPPVQEQRRIVGLLDRAAEIRRRADAACAKARAIIPALFLQTFGDPASNPKGWPIARLGSVVRLIGGGTPAKAEPSFWNGSIPWISPKDMKAATIVDSQDKITESALNASPVKTVQAGNVLIVVRGMILARKIHQG